MKNNKKSLSFAISAVLILSILIVNTISVLAKNNNIAYGFSKQDNFYSSSIQTNNEQLEETILNGWDQLKTKINVEAFNIHINDIGDIYFKILTDNPQYFYVASQLNYSYTVSTGTVTEVTVSYNYETNEIPALKTEFNQAVDNALKIIQPSMDDLQKALAIHDYLVLNCEYNSNFYTDPALIDSESFTAYGCLVNKIAVCQGYSYAYKLLLNKVGIESSIAVSEAMNHAWNLVKINGEFYHVDVTWDDSLILTGDGKHVDLIGKVGHNNFLLTDEQIVDHYGWVADDEVTNNIFENSFWSDVSSGIYYNDGNYYYINSSGNIIKKDSTSEEVIYDIKNGKWNENGGTYYIWNSNDAKIILVDDIIYFNTNDKIYSLDTRDNQEKVFYDSKLKDKYITGIGVIDNKIYYDTMDENLIFELRILAGEIENNNEQTTQSTEPSTNQTTNESSTQQSTSNNGETLYGDVNNDGEINGKDSLTLRKFNANYPGEIDKVAADVNVDGEVNAKDSLLIRRYIANWPVVLGQKQK